MSLSILDEPFQVSDADIQFYQENQFVKIKGVLPHDVVDQYAKDISHRVNELSKEEEPLEERDTYGKAFLQKMNLWTIDEQIKTFVQSKRVASIATQLMKVSGVRLYHDQALFKEPGGGYTPWHADQYYWPLSNDNTVTAWMPLQETPLTMGPLEFSAKSYQLQGGRDLKISDDSEQVISKKLRLGDFDKVVEPYEKGEVSFHSGWLFHRAGPNVTDQMRKVMTVIYMDKDIRLKKPENKNQQSDWETWCPGVRVGEVVDSPINPVLYEI